MNANELQASRIRRCCRFIRRHHPIPIETVARLWITRFARHWRARHGAVPVQVPVEAQYELSQTP